MYGKKWQEISNSLRGHTFVPGYWPRKSIMYFDFASIVLGHDLCTAGEALCSGERPWWFVHSSALRLMLLLLYSFALALTLFPLKCEHRKFYSWVGLWWWACPQTILTWWTLRITSLSLSFALNPSSTFLQKMLELMSAILSPTGPQISSIISAARMKGHLRKPPFRIVLQCQIFDCDW